MTWAAAIAAALQLALKALELTGQHSAAEVAAIKRARDAVAAKTPPPKE